MTLGACFIDTSGRAGGRYGHKANKTFFYRRQEFDDQILSAFGSLLWRGASDDNQTREEAFKIA